MLQCNSLLICDIVWRRNWTPGRFRTSSSCRTCSSTRLWDTRPGNSPRTTSHSFVLGTAVINNNVKSIFSDLGLELHGRPLDPPQIIFWNVRADTVGYVYPAAADDKGVILGTGLYRCFSNKQQPILKNGNTGSIFLTSTQHHSLDPNEHIWFCICEWLCVVALRCLHPNE